MGEKLGKILELTIFKLWFKIDSRIRFILVGGYNTVFAFILFCGLEYYLGENLYHMWILLITHIISVLNSFLTLRIFVFASKNNLLHEYIKVNVVYGFYFLGNSAMLFIFSDLLHFNVLLAQFLCVMILTVWAYFAHKHFSFKEKKKLA